MGKLVRDRIPEIIEAEGRVPETWVLEDEDYLTALLDKVVEEAEELRSAHPDQRLEEASDIYEVLLAVADHLAVDFEAVVSRAAAKRAERGGFTRRLWLESR